MRLVTIKTPQGQGGEVAALALRHGIRQAAVHQVYVHGPNQSKDVVEIETATPTAKAFLDDLLAAPFFNPDQYSISVRLPHSIVSAESTEELTKPVAVPGIDVVADLWQHNHITFSLVGRTITGGLLLAYGMLQNNLLTMFAGLLFIPLLPMLMATSLGALTRYGRLAWQGVIALVLGLGLLVLTGAGVAAVAGGPVGYNESSPLPVTVLIALIVGIAATLAHADDTGRRELIGLALASQLALPTTSVGLALGLGGSELAKVPERLVGLGVTVGTYLVVMTVMYGLMRMKAGRWQGVRD